jgi:hypothetical protein
MLPMHPLPTRNSRAAPVPSKPVPYRAAESHRAGHTARAVWPPPVTAPARRRAPPCAAARKQRCGELTPAMPAAASGSMRPAAQEVEPARCGQADSTRQAQRPAEAPRSGCGALALGPKCSHGALDRALVTAPATRLLCAPASGLPAGPAPARPAGPEGSGDELLLWLGRRVATA